MFLVLFILCLGATLACGAQTAKSGKVRTIPKAEKKAAEKARKAAEKPWQTIQDSMDYEEVIQGFRANKWAFETLGPTDQQGLPVPVQNRPNAVGFNGILINAFIILKHDKDLFGNKTDAVSYSTNILEGEVIGQRQETDKKGRLAYIYDIVYTPNRATVTAYLKPGTCVGGVNIKMKDMTIQYYGKFMPIEKCRYYIEGSAFVK